MSDLLESLHPDVRVLLRIGVAMVAALPLAWERERRDRPAGLRTHLMVALSAALITSLAPSMVEFVHGPVGTATYDPIRTFVAVMTGVAFLGAGTIFVRREEGITGLTTASSLFATASIGIAAGIERFLLAIGASALAFGVVAGLGAFQDRDDGGRS